MQLEVMDKHWDWMMKMNKKVVDKDSDGFGVEETVCKVKDILTRFFLKWELPSKILIFGLLTHSTGHSEANKVPILQNFYYFIFVGA